MKVKKFNLENCPKVFVGTHYRFEYLRPISQKVHAPQTEIKVLKNLKINRFDQGSLVPVNSCRFLH